MGIFHLNHMTRGNESDEDERFIQELSSRFGVPLFSERHDFSRFRTMGMSFEEEARKKRYAMLKDIAKRQHFTKIATAHSLNDHVETILMRISQKTEY